MTTNHAPTMSERAAPWDRPWLFVIGALMTTAAAWIVAGSDEGGTWTWLVLAIGLSSGAWGITVRRPTPKLMFAAALVPIVAAQALDPSWDTIRLLCHVAALIALVGAGILALSPWAQRLALSLLVLLHFLGIAAVTFSWPPPEGEASWIAVQLEARIFRPYLEFIYMTCTYRYYSPEAPPETLLWARLTYADGEQRWIKLPDAASRGSLTNLRMLGLAPPLETDSSVDVSEDMYAARYEAGRQYDPPMPEPGEDLAQEYQPPSAEGKALIASMVRHLARSYPHSSDAGQALTNIKVYCVVHRLVTAEEFVAGIAPNDPTTYQAYYHGDFTPAGELQPSCYTETRLPSGETKVRQDPLLYWLIPIVRAEDDSVTDYVRLHAQDDD